MYILFNSQLAPRFIDYGILIPIKAERSLKVFKTLKSIYPDLTEFPYESVPVLNRNDLLLAHNEDYAHHFVDELHCEKCIIKTYELVDDKGVLCRYDPDVAKYPLITMAKKVLIQAGATYLAMKNSLDTFFTYNLGGGMHHAMSFEGRGFCPINDIVIGIRKLQRENKVKNAWVIDVDAHKGDGTAEITKNDDSIITLSIHMKNGWPLEKNTPDDHPARIPSNIDIEIDKGEEETYLKKLKAGVHELKENYSKPDLVVIVNGSDPYEKDELPGTKLLNLTKEDMLVRDLYLYNEFESLNIPQTWVMSGGYGPYSYEIYTQFLLSILPRLMG